MGRFSNKTVMITGASSGIGEALALELALQGADLALASRRVERLEELAKKIRSLGRRAIAIGCDVTKDGDSQKAVERTLEEFGRLDVMVANAGFGVGGRFEHLELEDYRRQFETNVYGVLRAARAAFEPLKESKGSFAIVGSVMGHVVLPGSSPYAMSKFALRAFSNTLRHEWSQYGIAVTLISPGFVDSEFRQVDNQGARHADAEDSVPRWIRMPAATAARKIAAGIRRRRREAVITGHGKIIVFISHVCPMLLDLIIGSTGLKQRREAGK